MSYNHYLYLVPTYFHPPQREIGTHKQPLQPLEATIPLPVSMDLPILISHTNGTLQHDLSCLPSSTQLYVFKVHPCVSASFLFKGRIIFHRMYHHPVLTSLLGDSDADTKVWEPPTSSLALWSTFLTGLYILQHCDLFTSVPPPLGTVPTTHESSYTNFLSAPDSVLSYLPIHSFHV